MIPRIASDLAKLAAAPALFALREAMRPFGPATVPPRPLPRASITVYSSRRK